MDDFNATALRTIRTAWPVYVVAVASDGRWLAVHRHNMLQADSPEALTRLIADDAEQSGK
jgi:hypothetical protein